MILSPFVSCIFWTEKWFLEKGINRKEFSFPLKLSFSFFSVVSVHCYYSQGIFWHEPLWFRVESPDRLLPRACAARGAPCVGSSPDCPLEEQWRFLDRCFVWESHEFLPLPHELLHGTIARLHRLVCLSCGYWRWSSLVKRENEWEWEAWAARCSEGGP